MTNLFSESMKLFYGCIFVDTKTFAWGFLCDTITPTNEFRFSTPTKFVWYPKADTESYFALVSGVFSESVESAFLAHPLEGRLFICSNEPYEHVCIGTITLPSILIPDEKPFAEFELVAPIDFERWTQYLSGCSWLGMHSSNFMSISSNAHVLDIWEQLIKSDVCYMCFCSYNRSISIASNSTSAAIVYDTYFDDTSDFDLLDKLQTYFVDSDSNEWTTRSDCVMTHENMARWLQNTIFGL